MIINEIAVCTVWAEFLAKYVETCIYLHLHTHKNVELNKSVEYFMFPFIYDLSKVVKYIESKSAREWQAGDEGDEELPINGHISYYLFF